MRGTDAKSGKHLSGAAHLKQSVKDILTTPIGSRVLRRDYGSELPDLVDHPRDGSTRLKVVAATASALSRWEPRIIVSQVTVTFPGDSGIILSIEGIDIETGVKAIIKGVNIDGAFF